MTPTRRFARRAHTTALAAVALAFLGALATGCSRSEDPAKASASTGPRAVPVTVATVEQRDVPVTVTAIGNVQAVATVTVLSQISGQIQKVHFVEGQEVKAGQLLFTIDPRPFEAALAQAQANVARDQAALRQADAARMQRLAEADQARANVARDRAHLENAQTQEQRYQELVRREFVAREQYDQMRTNAAAMAASVRAGEAAIANALASAQAAEANVENARATLRAGEAMVDTARLNLGYTRITSPITGRTGNLLIHDGNVVKASDVGNPMVTINQVDPIFVTFAVPEQYLDEIRRFQAARTLRVEVLGAGGPGKKTPGELVFMNNAVDPATGMIQLKASFPNREAALWPGQFTNVAVTLTTLRAALVIPAQAIQTSQKGTYVFVVKPDATVEMRPVTPVLSVDGQSVVETGLGAGERVVTDGHLRLAPGARVDVKPAKAS
jgi:multidrug efflux system membrane fusion protein